MRLLTDEIKRLIKHYDELAEKWQYEYMDSGKPSSQRAWERNEAMADALRVVLSAQEDRRRLVNLQCHVMELDADDERWDLALAVKRLQKRVSEGMI